MAWKKCQLLQFLLILCFIVLFIQVVYGAEAKAETETETETEAEADEHYEEEKKLQNLVDNVIIEEKVQKLGWCGEEGKEVSVSVSDRRLKENVRNANISTLLESIERVQLKEFNYKYKQFFNPIFGEEQLGIIAQELAQILPSAIGIVEKRAVGDNDEPTIIENVHVFKSETLFMANIGATQQLAIQNRRLEETVDKLSGSLNQVSQQVTSGTKAQEELSNLKTKHQELESIAKEAHSRSEQAVKLEHQLSLMEKDAESQKSERQDLLVKIQHLDQVLTKEIKEQNDLHKDISTSTISLQASLNSVIENMKSLKEENEDSTKQLQMLQMENQESIKAHGKELESKHRELSEQVVSLVSEVTKHEQHKLSQQEEIKGTIESISKQKEMLNGVSQQIESMRKQSESFKALLDTKESEMLKNLDQVQALGWKNLSNVESQHRELISTLETKILQVEKELQSEIAVLKEEINKQAGQEIVEQRRILEAQLEIEKSKIDLEKTRAEEQRKTAVRLAEIESEKQAKETNQTLERVAKEEALKAKAQLEVIQAQGEAALREKSESAKHEQELLQARAKKEQEALLLEAKIAKEKEMSKQEAETKRERDNHDLRKEMARLEAQESREHTTQAIRTVSNEIIQALQLAASSPSQVLGAVGVLVVLALGIYGSREIMILWRTYIQSKLGQPSLVRETSMSKSRSSKAFSWLRARTKEQVRRVWWALNPPSAEKLEEEQKKEQKEKLQSESFLHFMSDVVLPKEKAGQINRIARSTRAAHENETPLRHVLFYGPPGTGKTMVARYLSKWCNLEYAIMSGADIAPLKDRAVTEIHNLFHWANKTPRGVLLFIDEADAFLASRDQGAGSISESLRNALTALLYHTGSASCKVMLVLATNRPGDLDRAVVDRIDESVQFELPSLRERELLVNQYYQSSVMSCVTSSQVTNEMLLEAARQTKGFSGREISKLMTTVQAHMFGQVQVDNDKKAGSSFSPRKSKAANGSLGLKLSSTLFRQVVSNIVDEHGKLNSFQYKKDYEDVFSFNNNNNNTEE